MELFVYCRIRTWASSWVRDHPAADIYRQAPTPRNIKVSHVALVFTTTKNPHRCKKRRKRTKGAEVRFGSTGATAHGRRRTARRRRCVQTRLHNITGRAAARPKCLTYTISTAARRAARRSKVIPDAPPCIQAEFFHRRVPPIFRCQIVTPASSAARCAAICSCEIRRFSSDPFSCPLSSEPLDTVRYAGEQKKIVLSAYTSDNYQLYKYTLMEKKKFTAL